MSLSIWRSVQLLAAALLMTDIWVLTHASPYHMRYISDTLYDATGIGSVARSPVGYVPKYLAFGPVVGSSVVDDGHMGIDPRLAVPHEVHIRYSLRRYGHRECCPLPGWLCP